MTIRHGRAQGTIWRRSAQLRDVINLPLRRLLFAYLTIKMQVSLRPNRTKKMLRWNVLNGTIWKGNSPLRVVIYVNGYNRLLGF